MMERIPPLARTTRDTTSDSVRAAYEPADLSTTTRSIPVLEDSAAKRTLARLDSKQAQLEMQAYAILAPPRGVFVAGEAPYSQEATGILRVEKPIELFSRRYGGLAVHGVLAGALFTFFISGFRPLLAAYLSMHNRDQFNAAKYLLEWPGSLAVFIGMLSDWALGVAYRRKIVIIIGWTLSLLTLVAITVLTFFASTELFYFGDPAKAQEAMAAAEIQANPLMYGHLFLTLSVVAVLGMQIAWVVSLATVVELSQRERLEQRGHLMALYLCLYSAGAFVVECVVSQILFPSDDGGLRSAITLGEASMMLAIGCLVPIPFTAFFLHEDTVQCASAAVSVAKRMQELWAFCHYSAMYRLLFFLLGHTFLIGSYDANVRHAVAQWSGVSAASELEVQIMRAAVTCGALIVWKLCLLNCSWRKLAFIGSIMFIYCYTSLTMVTTFRGIRSKTFFMTMVALTEIPRAWLKLFVVIPVIELASVGREGVMIGLMLSFQVLVRVATQTVSDTLTRTFQLDATPVEIAEDQPGTRIKVLEASLIFFGINLLGLTLVPLLPRQKLEAQELRAYGRYSTLAGHTIVACFVVLLLFDFTVNIAVIASP